MLEPLLARLAASRAAGEARRARASRRRPAPRASRPPGRAEGGAERRTRLAAALASRVRLLFDHGDTSTLEILFGARSLDEALVELDSLERVTVDQQRGARRSCTTPRRASAGRRARSRRARPASRQRCRRRRRRRGRSRRRGPTARRTSPSLRQQRQLNAAADRQARGPGTGRRRADAAACRARTAPSPTALATHRAGRDGRTLTVSAVAYSLPGHTASGLPVGWGSSRSIRA